MKHFLVGALALGFACSAFAGGTGDKGAASAKTLPHVDANGKTYITVALGDDPGTLDPAVYGAIMGIDAVAPMVRESLYERDGDLIPQLAKSMKVGADNLTYQVEIYDYIYDSAGNHFTADDVVFCFERAKTNNFNSTSFYDYVKKTGPYSVEMKLNNKTVGIFAQVAQVQACYTKKAFEDAKGDFGTKPVFTGPYKVTEWVSGSSLKLEKNEKYWQKKELVNVYGVQNVDIINYKIIKDSAQLGIALQTGEVDMVANMDPLEAAAFESGSTAKGFKVWTFPSKVTQFMYLSQNVKSPFAGDLELRKAVMYGLDIQGVIDGALNGLAVPARTFGNSQIVDYQKAWDTENYFEYDLAFAKASLAKSNYKGQDIRIMVSGNWLHGQLAVLLQGYLKGVGINSKIITYENALFNTYKYDASQWDIMFDQTSWAGPIPTQWRDKFDKRTFKGGKGGFIDSSDPKFQSLLEAADNMDTYSPAAVNAFHQYLKEQCYARGLFNQTQKTVTSDVVTQLMNHRIGVLFPSGCTYAWNK